MLQPDKGKESVFEDANFLADTIDNQKWLIECYRQALRIAIETLAKCAILSVHGNVQLAAQINHTVNLIHRLIPPSEFSVPPARTQPRLMWVNPNK